MINENDEIKEFRRADRKVDIQILAIVVISLCGCAYFTIELLKL